MPAIEFSRTHVYLPADDVVSPPVILSNGEERVKLLAQVDTGASHCLLGGLGWLDRIRLGLIDHDGVLYVASYD